MEQWNGMEWNVCRECACIQQPRGLFAYTSILVEVPVCIYPSCAPKQAAIMANTGEGTAANPILLEGTPPLPVKIMSGPRYR